VAGIALSTTLFGCIFSPTILGISGFLILYLILQKMSADSHIQSVSSLSWIGKHSYSIFLLHNLFITPVIFIKPEIVRIGAIVVAIGVSFLASVILEKLSQGVLRSLQESS
jgi:peptidoglycan/LPS O-acetylase OafA/YrhL